MHTRLSILFILLAAAAAPSLPGQIPVLHDVDGSTPELHFGIAVDAGGDVDGDGVGDLIVGATDGGAVTRLVGRAFVLSGADASVLHRFRAHSAGIAFGDAVAIVGDVDGDGHADLAVGARYDSTRAVFAGSVQVYSGRNGRVLHTFHGVGSGDRLGVSVDGAGDVDGDGHADIVAGAYFANANGFWSGSVFVWSGRTGRELWAVHGDHEYHFLGAAVAGAGDVDGDGLDDVVAGAYGDDALVPNGGLVRVYSGRDGHVLHENHGEFVGGRLGSAVAGLGDVDGDGHADFAAGAWDADTVNGNGSGMARVYSGADGSTLYTLRGDGPSERFGSALAAAGDTQGDGVPDLVVGAYTAVNGGIRSGSVRVFSGADGRRIADFAGVAAAELFGAAVAGGIDSNGDGLDDLVAGAPGDDDGGRDAGGLRVLAACGAERYGAASGGPATLALDWQPRSTPRLVVSGATPNAAGGLLVGLDEARRGVGSLTILVGLRAGRWVFVSLTFDGAGGATLPLDLRVPALAGTVLRAQALDTSGPAVSNGLRLLLCR